MKNKNKKKIINISGRLLFVLGFVGFFSSTASVMLSSYNKFITVNNAPGILSISIIIMVGGYILEYY